MCHQGIGGENGGIFGNFERNAPHEDHDPDGIFLGLFDGKIFGKTENGVGQDGLTAFEPTPGDKDFIEGLADFSFELRAGNFLGQRAVKAQEAIGRDGAGFGVGFGEGLGIGIGLIENNYGVSGEIRCLGGRRWKSFGHSKRGKGEERREKKKRRHRGKLG